MHDIRRIKMQKVYKIKKDNYTFLSEKGSLLIRVFGPGFFLDVIRVNELESFEDFKKHVDNYLKKTEREIKTAEREKIDHILNPLIIILTILIIFLILF
jgi:hypothetical protein